MGGLPEPGDAGMSDREAEVFALLGERLTHAEIGARLFISVRTVESHVASLRRKLGVDDRRGLVDLAEDHRARRAEPVHAPVVPSPVSSFVGRVAERAALDRALTEARLVSAVGPGGVGKTRLALAFAREVGERFPGGVWYVDLVPVADSALVAARVLATVGAPAVLGVSPEDALVAVLADRRALLVLDNCEHLANTVAVLVERLLAACDRLRVLVATRLRLVVPFERVYTVPGLSLPDDHDPDHAGDDPRAGSDAVALFLERAAAVGYVPQAGDLPRIAGLCRALDGMALAIELAAARLPSVGLAGLEAGLAEGLGLLSGGSRLDRRHRSMRDTLDWSYRLLDPVGQAVLRRISVFATPFAVDAAAEVTGFPPIEPGLVAGALARLCEQSLLMVVTGDGDVRYRALEVVRQYGILRLDEAGEPEVRTRHLRWCLAQADRLDQDGSHDDAWCRRLDAVVDDLRAALAWAAHQPGHTGDAQSLAVTLAALLFRRGRTAEAQRRYEEAAYLAAAVDEDGSAADALRRAAAVAKCRILGNDALRLERAAAEAAARAGDRPAAAAALARAAELIGRFPGMFAELPPPQTVPDLLAAARLDAGSDPAAQTALLVAEAHAGDRRDPVTTELAHRAIELARRGEDPGPESAALDLLQVVEVDADDPVAAAAIGRSRVGLLAHLHADPTTAFELKDALHVTSRTSVGAGDLPGARAAAEHQRDLPFLREERGLADEGLLIPAAFAGDWDRVLATAERFHDDWVRAGRPRAPGRGMATAAIAMVHGLRGDDDARRHWLTVLADIRGVDPEHTAQGPGYDGVFDAIVLLHRSRPARALDRIAADNTGSGWNHRLLGQWQLALRAEAAVLSGHPDAAAHLARADVTARGNPIATAIARRAHALATADTDALVATAPAFRTAGCHYQWARTLALTPTDNPHHDQGRTALQRMGATNPNPDVPRARSGT